MIIASNIKEVIIVVLIISVQIVGVVARAAIILAGVLVLVLVLVHGRGRVERQTKVQKWWWSVRMQARVLPHAAESKSDSRKQARQPSAVAAMMTARRAANT